MDAPRRGNEHIARGRAKRHPGNQTPTLRALQGQKHKNIQYINCKYLIINAFALSGRVCTIVLFPGCRFALPRAMCSLPFQGASIQSASILYPSDYVV